MFISPNNQQTSINQAKTSNLEVPNNQQVQQSKGDGDFEFEKGLKGLKETTKIWEPNENKIVQPVEQVNDKK